MTVDPFADAIYSVKHEWLHVGRKEAESLAKGYSKLFGLPISTIMYKAMRTKL